jgi:hypothetical protein
MLNFNLYLSSTVIISVFHKPIRINLKSPASWDITPCSTLKLNRRFGGACSLHPQRRRALLATCSMPVSCSAYSSTWRLRQHVPPNVVWLSTNYSALFPRVLHNHCCENLKSYKSKLCYYGRFILAPVDIELLSHLLSAGTVKWQLLFWRWKMKLTKLSWRNHKRLKIASALRLTLVAEIFVTFFNSFSEINSRYAGTASSHILLNSKFAVINMLIC